jgi:3-oxoadipate enol-lactonase
MRIITNNIKIYEEGNNRALPIIFVHGFPFDNNMWKDQINELSSGFYCISYDIRGLGESSAGDGQYTMELFVDDLFSVIDMLKIDQPVLCGLSMGGYIVLRAVEKMERKFRGLILCDTKSEADSDEGKLKRAEGIKKINEEGLESFIPDFLDKCFADQFKKNKISRYQQIIERSIGFDPIGVKGCLLAMAGRTDTTSSLSKINIPSLVLCGEKDNLLTPVLVNEMSNKIHDSQFFIVPDAGHIVSIENPGFVNEMILTFLKKLE